MTIPEIVKEISRFSPDVLEVKPAVDPKKIEAFELNFGVLLPLDFKSFLGVFNGLKLFGSTILGIENDALEYGLWRCTEFEQNVDENPIPNYLIPFAPDGGGNHYCFDTRFNDDISCPIIFWQYDYNYSDEDPPEVVNESFAFWVQDVILDWNLEDYNYDGSEK
jgi:cell wall assembly regulator SMI1